ncbi:TPA: hypothetical protein EYP70_07075 [Candidatus Bathyarchaeota archaeon]|nr:hypothetical protein [Candidatus Bathyarchaeota archaeon]
MPKVIICGVYPRQILAYLEGEKDCELRKAAPNPKEKLGKRIEEVPLLIKTAGSPYGYIVGEVDEVIKGRPSEIWERYSQKFKFGIEKEIYDEYFSGAKQATVIHFAQVKLIYPPLEGINSSQTFRYGNIPEQKWNLHPLSNETVRERLVELTKKIQKELREKYRHNKVMLNKIG